MVDTSVWVWAQRTPAIREQLIEASAADEVAICHPVLLELLYSARTAVDYAAIRRDFDQYHCVRVEDDVWERALDVYGMLAAQGGAHQRQVAHPDLLIAAAAELAGIPVLHYDEDYDRIAAVTGQDARWVRPRGSL